MFYDDFFWNLSDSFKQNRIFSLYTDESITGEVEVSLQFNEPNMFSITLHQGYHLKIANSTRETSNPFARVYATGLPNKYETKVRFP